MSVPESCAVCFDAFNKTTRAQTACPFCGVKVCRTCLQTYLLSDVSDVPRCVNTECGNGWEREFLDGEFTRSFRLITYKEHREKVLSDRERARMPATQEDAAAYRNAVILERTSGEEEKRLNSQIIELERARDVVGNRKYHARRVIATYGQERIGEDGRILHVSARAKPVPVAFVKPCPAPDCRGFLSTAWKCGLCDLYSCPDCHELKGESRDTEHTCDADKVATVRLLERDSRNCPKCGVTITKLEGCDQMWCTACNTGFSWRTGRIAEGPVHNPHYFQWLQTQGRDPHAAPAVGRVGDCEADLDRRVAQALIPANPHMLGAGYGGIYGARRLAALAPQDEDTRFLIEAWRLMREGQDLNRQEAVMEERFRILRVRHMIGDLTEEAWKTSLQRAEKDVNFARSVRQVRDVYVGAVRDLVRQILNDVHDKKEIRRQVEELIDYCNRSYEEVTKRFGRVTPRIAIKVTR
jgi:hypothetical protein